jgi:CDP-diacylglycerol---glycerol-3-phosphate 3-phosphatidyltransferase
VSAPEVLAQGPEGEVSGYKNALKKLAHQSLDPLVRALLAIGLKADHLTAIGFMFSIAAGLEFATGRFRLAATLASAAGVCDILDGQVARMSGKVTRFGAFFDSTLDRVAEAALFLGVSFYYSVQLVDMAANPGRVVANLQRGLEPITFAMISMLAMFALVGSFMVSYSRARAEGLGLDCKVGWFERPERMVLLIIAGFAGLGPVMPAALLVLVVFSFATAIQRMAHVWKLTRNPGSSSTEV